MISKHRRAAAQANVPMILSGASLTTLERVRDEGPTAWFQAYLPGETGPITELVERVARAGYDTLCLTVDVPVGANREHNVRSGYHTPLREEVDRDMALLGIATLAEMRRERLMDARAKPWIL